MGQRFPPSLQPPDSKCSLRTQHRMLNVRALILLALLIILWVFIYMSKTVYQTVTMHRPTHAHNCLSAQTRQMSMRLSESLQRLQNQQWSRSLSLGTAFLSGSYFWLCVSTQLNIDSNVCHRLRFESETKCSESSPDEGWMRSDLPLQEEKVLLKVWK